MSAFFFGVVSQVEEENGLLRHGRLRLYTNYNLACKLFDEDNCAGIGVCFDAAHATADANNIKTLRAVQADLQAHLAVGNLPVAESVLTQFAALAQFSEPLSDDDREEAVKIITTLRAWIAVMVENHRLSSAGVFQHVSWTTNAPSSKPRSA